MSNSNNEFFLFKVNNLEIEDDIAETLKLTQPGLQAWAKKDFITHTHYKPYFLFSKSSYRYFTLCIHSILVYLFCPL